MIIKSRSKQIMLKKATILIVAFLLLINDILFALTDRLPSQKNISNANTLAAESRLKPFSEQNGLNFQSASKMIYAAAQLRGLIDSKFLRQSHVIRLNKKLFPSGEVSIDPDIRDGKLASGKEYKLAVFHFRKEKETINALFIRNQDEMTDKELAELGVRTEEDKRHFHSSEYPALRGVWFTNPQRNGNATLSSFARGNEIISQMEAEKTGSSRDLRRALRWFERNADTDSVLFDLRSFLLSSVKVDKKYADQVNNVEDVLRSGKGVCWEFVCLAHYMLYMGHAREKFAIDDLRMVGFKSMSADNHITLLVRRQGAWWMLDNLSLERLGGESYEDAKTAALDKFRRGELYVAVDINPEIRVDEEKNEISITYDPKNGREIFVGGEQAALMQNAQHIPTPAESNILELARCHYKSDNIYFRRAVDYFNTYLAGKRATWEKIVSLYEKIRGDDMNERYTPEIRARRFDSIRESYFIDFPSVLRQINKKYPVKKEAISAAAMAYVVVVGSGPESQLFVSHSFGIYGVNGLRGFDEISDLYEPGSHTANGHHRLAWFIMNYVLINNGLSPVYLTEEERSVEGPFGTYPRKEEIERMVRMRTRSFAAHVKPGSSDMEAGNIAFPDPYGMLGEPVGSDTKNIVYPTEEEEFEYGLKSGVLPNIYKPVYRALVKILRDHNFTSAHLERVAQTLARMRPGSLEIIYRSGVISKEAKDALIGKDSAALAGLTESAKDELVGSLQHLMVSYDKYFSENKTGRAFAMKRLIPVSVIEDLAAVHDINPSTVMSVIAKHPDFPIWIKKAKAKVELIKNTVSGANNAWLIVVGQGIEDTDAWLERAGVKADEIKNNVGGAYNAWIIIINHGIENTDGWLKDAAITVESIKNTVGGVSVAWPIVIKQGTDNAGAWVKGAAAKVESIKDIVGGAKNAWQIVVGQGVKNTDKWVDKAGSKVASLKDIVGGSSVAWQIVLGQGIDNTDKWVKNASAKAESIKNIVGGNALAWLIIVKRGVGNTDDWVKRAAAKVDELRDIVVGPSNAWRIVISHGIENTDGWVKRAAAKVEKIKDTVRSPHNAWLIVIKQGIEDAESWAIGALPKVRSLKDKVGGEARAWERVIKQGIEDSDKFPDAEELPRDSEMERDGGVTQSVVPASMALAEDSRVSQNRTSAIHAANLDLTPIVPEKTILCHIVTDSILPAGQRNMLKALEQDMRSEKYSEKVVSLSISGMDSPEEFMAKLQALKAREEARYQGYKVEFDVACPDKALVEKIQKHGMRALAFAREAEGDIVQVEGIILALRALQTGSVEALADAYKLLTGKSPMVNGADINELARAMLFILPVRKLDVNKIGILNRLIEENIKSAA